MWIVRPQALENRQSVNWLKELWIFLLESIAKIVVEKQITEPMIRDLVS